MSFAGLLGTIDRTILDHLGDPVTYQPGTGDSVECVGVFDETYRRVDPQTPGVSTTGPAVFLLLVDLPTGAANDPDARVTINGAEYSIREPQPDGKGGIVLLLHYTA